MYRDVGSLKSYLCLRTNCTYFSLKTGSLGNWWILIHGLNTAFWELSWLGAPAMQYRPHLPLYFLLSAILHWCSWHHKLLPCDILATQFELSFLSPKRHELKGPNNRQFWPWTSQTLEFKNVDIRTKWKQISLYRYLHWYLWKWCTSCRRQKYRASWCHSFDNWDS